MSMHIKNRKQYIALITQICSLEIWQMIWPSFEQKWQHMIISLRGQWRKTEVENNHINIGGEEWQKRNNKMDGTTTKIQTVVIQTNS